VPAVDSHCHVFDTEAFPYAADAAYRPPAHEAGTVDDLCAVHDAHAITHALLVNPTSGYGYDNRCMLAALRAHPLRFKGIARVRPDIDDRALDELQDAGVIGIRIDLVGDGPIAAAHPAVPRLLARMRDRAMQVHVQCEGDQLVAAAPILRAARVPLVIDHVGRPDYAKGVAQPGFRCVLDLGRDGHALKLSGPFRFVPGRAPYEAADAYVHAALEAFTLDRCVWGSDWPFLRMPARVDYGPVLSLLTRWIPAAADRERVLWATPARLFGFHGGQM
jgi:predicted TIM-barrel fold metal-dependent hydrolase